MRLGADRYTRRLRNETGMSPFRAEVAKQGRTATVDCRSVTVVPPPADVAERLNLDPESGRVVRRENWYFADAEPIQVGVTHVPVDVAGKSVIATERSMGKDGIYLRFEELGYLITRIREEVSARMPSPDELTGLALPPGVPVIEVLHTSFDAAQRPFEVTRFVIRALPVAGRRRDPRRAGRWRTCHGADGRRHAARTLRRRPGPAPQPPIRTRPSSRLAEWWMVDGGWCR
jgi:GntR family transcriptional regulator